MFFLGFLSFSYAQEKEIEGKVVDDKNFPLVDAYIFVTGKNEGVYTKEDGTYQIKAKPGDEINFEYIGFNPVKKKVTEKTSVINVTMKSGVVLDEVVTTGYQKTDRKLFAGAATKIKADDAKIDGMVDVGRMMEGRAAGVSVQNVSGTFGAAPKIRVRGASSIYGDTKPLWVVDGVVLEDVVDVSPDQLSSGDISTLISSSVAGLNAEDIESFQILKDASATALYGARAMNGVIVITTKNGSSGKVNIDVKSEFSIKARPRYSQYDILNSQDQMSVFMDMDRKGWLTHADMMRSKDAGVFFQMYDAINEYKKQNGYGLINYPTFRAEYLRNYEYVNTDWFDLLFNNSLQQNHSISFKGGSKKSKFYASTSYLHDEGWSIADKVDRYTVNMKGTFDINDKLSLGISSKGSYRDQKAPGTFGRESNAVTGTYSREFDINPFSYALNTSRTVTPFEKDGSYRYNRMNYAKFNILEEFKNNYINLNVLDLNIQGNLDYKINKKLNYSFVGNIRYVKSTTEHRVTAQSNVARAYRSNEDSTIEDNNPYLWSDPEKPNERPIVVLPKGGFYNREDHLLKNFYFRNILEYKDTYNDVHSVNAIFGQEIKSADRNTSGFEGYGIQYDRGNTVFTDPNLMKKLTQSGFPYFGISNSYDRFAAFFANGAYSYLGKYIFNVTVRLDGSNKLGSAKDARWLPTWNVSGRWNAKDEKFLQDVDWLSQLNLRATYGLTASMGPATNSRAVFRSGITVAPFPDEVQNGLRVASLMNSELTWEKQYELNVGFDLGVFNNRLSVSADFYRRNGFDLIASVKTSGIGGELWKLTNYADMKSHGFEFSLNSRNIKNDDFSWNTDLTFAYNKNEITKLYGEPSILGLTRAEGAAKLGGPVRGIYSIPFAGLDSQGIPTFYTQDGSISKKIFFQDTKVDHLIYEGSVDPKVTGGFSNKFKYKAFALNVFCTYQFGNKIRVYPSFHASYSDLDAMPKDFKNRWLMSGDENKTNIPTILSKRYYELYGGNSMEATYNAFNYSDQRVAKGDFVRLKEVSLSYDLPKKIVQKSGISNANIRLSGSNLWLIYSDKALQGQDPEFFGAGGVALPVAKQYTVTLRLSL
ncbi:SusC/RagA family TonB-linked outer membrane protein [Ornithobacterium rhinotracheale]|uniref:SusC/RagA family TonB-linked outer membrane protein n=1 Tax=Ornithobacterium rhinotracheale TaxID=28251 RepID=UPI0040372B52